MFWSNYLLLLGLQFKVLSGLHLLHICHPLLFLTLVLFNMCTDVQHTSGSCHQLLFTVCFYLCSPYRKLVTNHGRPASCSCFQGNPSLGISQEHFGSVVWVIFGLIDSPGRKHDRRLPILVKQGHKKNNKTEKKPNYLFCQIKIRVVQYIEKKKKFRKHKNYNLYI